MNHQNKCITNLFSVRIFPSSCRKSDGLTPSVRTAVSLVQISLLSLTQIRLSQQKIGSNAAEHFKGSSGSRTCTSPLWGWIHSAVIRSRMLTLLAQPVPAELSDPRARLGHSRVQPWGSRCCIRLPRPSHGRCLRVFFVVTPSSIKSNRPARCVTCIFFLCIGTEAVVFISSSCLSSFQLIAFPPGLLSRSHIRGLMILWQSKGWAV